MIRSVEFEFFRSLGYPWEKRRFLVELHVFLKVRGVLELSRGVSHKFFRLIAESIAAGVSVVRCILRFAKFHEKNEKQSVKSCCARRC